MSLFSHIDDKGRSRMVDITDKEPTLRFAVAQGVVSMEPSTFEMIHNNSIKKGNVLETARIAGIMAAKKTSELIPMCHPINISHIDINFEPDKETSSIKVKTSVRLFGQTGVEMEALTAASVAALTIYDMCKSQDKRIIISDICLLEKSGGKSGIFVREKQNI
ncbi:MAG: cyclic pyranopterin monophosphate synthase MoaC [Proteobacteria bacterium]|nr:cyclic pyranopterin monophosphate synthase MoaC [Desulfobacteraceae bacterium]MBU4012969.1 cyclic pyranopterin monophosphate synthase MoaC [Pseudomonadota bacterium]MBU4069096.1 cyclic pyranopterin monophosphate synthase MoaC [Pseudomonadota bacterium]MBU4100453.1 cyclic pyranopterin monophosphate synthase MoaC [Pseudomonadota bacterium]MBU4127122.1 cyclic pyranopterin monophosphate synthase MoaC [Pseudomonadota bacterium]